MNKNTALFVVLLIVLAFATKTFSTPYAQNNNLYVFQYQATPSWYVSSASPNTLYTYAYPSSLSATVRRYTTAYSFATTNYWLSVSLGSIYNGASYDGDNYELRYSYSTTPGASGTFTYTLNQTVFKYNLNSTGTVGLYYKISASASLVYNVTVIFYSNNQQVYRYTASPSQTSVTYGWYSVSFSAPTGNNTLNMYVYCKYYSSSSTASFSLTLEIDKVTVQNGYLVNWYDGSYTMSYSSGVQSGLQTGATYTVSIETAVNYSKPVSLSPSPASYTYASSKGSLTVTAYYNAQSQSLASGTVTLPKPSGYGVLQYIAKAPQGYYIWTNSSTQEFLDEAYVSGSATALKVTLVQPSWKAVYTLAQKYVFSVLNSSSISVGSVLLPAGKYLVFVSSTDPSGNCYLKLNTTLLYSASFLNNTVLVPPQSGTSTITFTVQDYGVGYQLLQVADLQGRIVGSGLVGSTGQVALNLTPYTSYVLSVCKTGLCKSVGLVTISSSNIQLSVMPTVPTVKPASLVSAGYDYTDKMLIVNVSCQAPPCYVTIRKILANGTQATYVILPACQQPTCGYAIASPDPYFQVIANDSSGKLSQASTGLSVPLWNSPLGNVTSTLGNILDFNSLGVNVNDFIILLIGLAILYGAFTYRNWELGIIVLGVWVTVGTLLLGGSGKLMVPGLSLAIFGAVISYMLKREQQP